MLINKTKYLFNVLDLPFISLREKNFSNRPKFSIWDLLISNAHIFQCHCLIMKKLYLLLYVV